MNFESMSVCVLILLSTQIDCTQSSVSWNMTTYPAVFGQDVMLACYTLHPLKSSEECPIRVWSGGSDGQRLTYNGFSSNEEKYEEIANGSSSLFSLIIRNFSVTDINVNYTCSCGFFAHTDTLQLDEKRFKYLPDAANVSITSYNDTLRINLHLITVYPLPTCSVFFGNRSVSKKLRLSYRKKGLFFTVSFVSEYKQIGEDCNRKPRLQFDLNGLNITFEGNVTHCPDYPTKTRVNGNCTLNDEDFNKRSSSHPKTMIAIVSCICLVVFAVLCYLLRKYLQRIKEKRYETSDENITFECILLNVEENANNKLRSHNIKEQSI